MLTLSNFSHTSFAGWARVSVPAKEHQNDAAMVACKDGTRRLAVFGRTRGQGRSAWLRIRSDKPLESQSALLLDFTDALPVNKPAPSPMLPEVARNPAAAFAPSINGVPLLAQFDENKKWLHADGPALHSHFRGRITELVWSDLWLTWVPEEKWFRWELLLNAASPMFGHKVTELQEHGFELRVGDATVATYGGLFGKLMEGQSIAQGQGRAFAGVGAWLDQCDSDERAQLHGMLTGAPVGVDDRFRDMLAGMGVPEPQDGFNVQQWVRQHSGHAYSAMAAWPGVQGLGIARNAGVTGAQEEQVFCAHGTECFTGGVFGGAALLIRYLTALTYSRRPCHWREDDGTMLNWEHENLAMWGGGPHYSAAVSPDQLGLVRHPTEHELHGWMGPDREHWFYGSLYTAAVLWGSDLCQWLLEAQARIVHYRETVDTSLSTSGVDAARSVGWFGIIANALDLCLEDDETRARVKARAKDRLEMVYLPSLHRPEQQWTIWDPRTDARLLKSWLHHFTEVVVLNSEGEEVELPGQQLHLPSDAISWKVHYQFEHAWMPYQQAVGAFGLFLLGQMFANEDALACAQHAADTVTRLAYQADPEGTNGMQTWATLPLKPGTMEPIEVESYRSSMQPGTTNVTWFRHAWLPLALWVRLQKPGEPDALARQWWELTFGEHSSGNKVMQWMPPEDRAVVTSPS